MTPPRAVTGQSVPARTGDMQPAPGPDGGHALARRQRLPEPGPAACAHVEREGRAAGLRLQTVWLEAASTDRWESVLPDESVQFSQLEGITTLYTNEND